ncbi:BQ2448_3458 [Microbotryum intermedium]|uniref:BQ2448_3458 protein n=1 Tax=Microbotryum intermedium TaxID=269621 RepID=A0A238FI01_9BASI|nr:BQ2448_3458 [Microbotryum intermedium]
MHFSALLCSLGAMSTLVLGTMAHPDLEWYRQHDLLVQEDVKQRSPIVATEHSHVSTPLRRRSCVAKARQRTAVAAKSGADVRLQLASTKGVSTHIRTSSKSSSKKQSIARKHRKTKSKKKTKSAVSKSKSKLTKHRTLRKTTTPKKTTTKKTASNKKKVTHNKKTTHKKKKVATKKASGVKAKLESKTGKNSGSGSSGTVFTSNNNGDGPGLFGVSTSQCGASGATESITKSSGPNGAESWLNCGFSPSNPNSGWTPPYIKISQLRAISMEEALAMPNSVFSACKPYVYLFEKYGSQLGLPPILIASIAMQESSCNAGTMGDNGGAWGLMQITTDKCGGAPNGNCADPDYNVGTGARYLKGLLDQQNGDVLVSLGMYNGCAAVYDRRYRGLTYYGATKIKDSCFQCQNNGDYHQQLLNGWMQGIDGSQLGTIRNIG